MGELRIWPIVDDAGRVSEIAREAGFSRNKQNWSTFTEILLFIRNEMLTIGYMKE